MGKIDMEVDDFINYCDYKGLATKTIGSYEQTLRLFIKYLKEELNITNSSQVTEAHIKNYITNVKERGKYTVVVDNRSKKQNIPEHRQDYGKKVSIATVNNYTRNIKVYFNYMYDSRLIKTNPVRKVKEVKTPQHLSKLLNNNLDIKSERVYDILGNRLRIYLFDKNVIEDLKNRYNLKTTE